MQAVPAALAACHYMSASLTAVKLISTCYQCGNNDSNLRKAAKIAGQMLDG